MTQVGDDYYEVLGVTRDSSDDEIRDAHRSLARQFHPDEHPNASAAERALWSDAMARVNQAYNALKGRATRPAPSPGGQEQARQEQARQEQVRQEQARQEQARQQQARQEQARQQQARQEQVRQEQARFRPPTATECTTCGFAGAAQVRFRQQSAYLIASRLRRFEGRLCRSCARAIGRSYQNRTLWRGWWGLFAFCRNFAYVFGNARVLGKIKKLPLRARNGQLRDPLVVTPRKTPLDPGRSIFARSGVWLVAALLTAGSAGALVAAADQPGTWSADQPGTWSVGGCLRGDVRTTTDPIAAVPCSDRHDARIVAIVEVATNCADFIHVDVQHQGRVSHQGRVYCVDSNG